MIVLLDTNFLLLPHQHGVDVFSEIERLVPEKHEVATLSTVVGELEELTGPSKDGVAANVALQLLREKGVVVLPAEGGVDESIVEKAGGGGVLVGTNDRELKSQLRSKGVELLVLRGRNHLERI